MTGTGMRAVVLADRDGTEFGVLVRDTCVALLPAAGKPLLQYSLEFLARAGIRDVLLAVSAHADQVERFVQNGERWGLEVRTVLTQGNLEAAEVLRRNPPSNAAATLVLRGDMVRDLDPGAIPQTVDRVTRLTSGGHNLAVSIVPTAGAVDDALLASLDWPPRACGAQALEVTGAQLFHVEDVRAFHALNLALVSTNLKHLVPDGRRVDGVWTGIGARYATTSVKGSPVYVGRSCDVNATAELLDNVVLNADVVVDRNATLRNAVVLPHTYIGDMVNVQNAVVAGDTMIDIDSGHALSVVDRFLLSDMRRSTLGGTAADAVGRVLAALILLASLPLWPLAVLASLGRGRLTDKVALRGNRRLEGDNGGFEARLFATRIPVLRCLPLLAAVVRGRLGLVGVSPLTPEEDDSRETEWERVRDRAVVGLLGPTQLRLGASAPLEDRLLSDAWYASRRSVRGDLGWLLRSFAALFSARAWTVRVPPDPSR